MKIICLQPSGYECNSYIVSADGKNCVLIDCPSPTCYDRAVAVGYTPRAVLLTHGHLDHAAGCKALSDKGAHIYCGEGEKDFIFSQGNQSIFGIPVPQFQIYKTLTDGEELQLYGIDIKVIATPGHTVGGVCYVIGDSIFTGDTLFFGSVGRCDFATGDEKQLINSVKKLYALAGDYTLYTGHGQSSLLSRERAHNSFVRQ